MIGRKFGRWLVVGVGTRKTTGQGRHLCVCDCGNTAEVDSYNLKSGKSKSCGCLSSEMLGAMTTTHGRSKTKLYRVWKSMRSRCINKNTEHWDRYGGRGITVCERWLHSFENFLSDMGERPEGTEIDRIDNSGNYEPSNCHWATKKQNSRNRSNNVFITFNEETLPIFVWAERTGIPVKTLHDRYRAQKWSAEKTLTTPVKINGKG